MSPEQLAANRANAQKSTGPVTDAGKQRSSLNAMRHGLTSHVILLPHEDMEAFNRHTARITESLNLVGEVELQLGHQYAGCQWRLNRIAAIEDNMFSVGLLEDIGDELNFEDSESQNAASYANTFRNHASAFDTLGRYSARLTNQSCKILKEIREVQNHRRVREQYDLDKAIVVYKAHKMANAIFDPKAFGFVSSLSTIEDYYDFKNMSDPAHIREMIKKGRVKAA